MSHQNQSEPTAFDSSADGTSRSEIGQSIGGKGFIAHSLQQYPWLVFVLPFFVYLLTGSIEPRPPKPSPVATKKATTTAEAERETSLRRDVAKPESIISQEDSAKRINGGEEKHSAKKTVKGTDQEKHSTKKTGENTDKEEHFAKKIVKETDKETHSAGKMAKSDEEWWREAERNDQGGWRIPYRYYVPFYAVRLSLTILAILLVFPGYRQFPFRISPTALLVGVVGVVLWVGVCRLDLEQRLLTPLGLQSLLGLGERAAYNPFHELGTGTALIAFLAVRFLGLAIIVPLIEEFFLRGFVMRVAEDSDWTSVPFGTAGITAILAGTFYGMLTHPAELFAAILWFSLITWLMLRTRNIWDCVAAHATTNLLLGIYVIISQDWALW